MVMNKSARNRFKCVARAGGGRADGRLKSSPPGNRRSGMAALEVVLTSGITMLMFSFVVYWGIRLSRIVFSVIGEMVGSPLM
jgi:hypothetical protein